MGYREDNAIVVGWRMCGIMGGLGGAVELGVRLGWEGNIYRGIVDGVTALCDSRLSQAGCGPSSSSPELRLIQNCCARVKI